MSSACKQCWRLLPVVMQSFSVRTQSMHSIVSKLDLKQDEAGTSHIYKLSQQYEALTFEDKKELVFAYNHLLPHIYDRTETMKKITDNALLHILEEHYFDDREVALSKHLSHAEELLQTEREIMRKEDKQTNHRNSDKSFSVKNTIMLWLQKPTEMKFYKNNAAHSMMFGTPLIIDCDYEDYMKNRELPSLTRQILMLYMNNIQSAEPFDLHLCNLKENAFIRQPLGRDQPALNHCMFQTSSQCPTEMFDKERLVMLSPDAPLYMEKFDPNDIYIIGGYVDLSASDALSYEKAEKLGIRCKQFPLDIWLDWPSGASKRLTLVTVYDILEHLKTNDNDWKGALAAALPPRYKERMEMKEDIRRLNPKKFASQPQKRPQKRPPKH